jgi:glutaminyl-peptide cyclotransferase
VSVLRLRAAGLALLIALGGCASKAKPPAPAPVRIEELVPQVVASYPHDKEAFTQGLLYFDGWLYESTGLTTRSSLRRVELETGRVDQRVALEPTLFGEGLARIEGQLFQITWKDGRAFVWDLGGFKKLREHAYQGEGWGLCHDGHRLIMSDGSDKLAFRDPTTFAKHGELTVTRAGEPVRNLNELECVGDLVYANVWMDWHIARIDARTGEVTGWIDASTLLTPEERLGADVLNGIAYRPDRGTFLITGKLWPRLFEVRFVPRAGTTEGHP